MELKIKYQYTDYIYPFFIQKANYEKYLMKILKDKRFKIKLFEKQKDNGVYTYFNPNVRAYMFQSFEFDKKETKDLLELSNEMKVKLLKKMPCTFFEYNVAEDVAGKLGDESSIMFKMPSFELICFNTGICFLKIKTYLEGTDKFSDLLNFNYKFRDCNLEDAHLKKYENIKIQTDMFESISEIKNLIIDITGQATDDNLFTYSYACIDSENWNNQNNFEGIQNEYLKFSNILPSSYNLNLNQDELKAHSKWEYIRFGFSKLGGVTLSSGIEPFNYTRLPVMYENEYLYTMVLSMYQKLYLNMLEVKFNSRNKNILKQARKEFADFTKRVYFKDITNNVDGNIIYDKWQKCFEIENLYNNIKTKYDVIYKDEDIKKITRTNNALWIIILLTLLLGWFNLLVIAYR